MIGNFEFQNPWWLLLLIVAFFLIILKFKKKAPQSTLKIPTIEPFSQSQSTLTYFKPLLFILRIAGISCMIIAMARPQSVEVSSTIKSDKGVDVLMVVDISLSMLAKDLKPNRLEALKNVAQEFVNQRPTDRIGMVAYSGEAIAKVPLTTDHNVLIQEIQNLETGVLEDGTAIGVGLATAINHIKDSKATSKVVILITDGVESIDHTNDLLYVSPQTAAQIAASQNIKVYTIGVGTNGMAPFPSRRDFFTGEIIFDMHPVEIDEPMLKYIAAQTGGEYFRATDNQTLDQIYKKIDQLEKTEINEIKYYSYTELFTKFLIIGIILILIEVGLRQTLFKELT